MGNYLERRDISFRKLTLYESMTGVSKGSRENCLPSNVGSNAVAPFAVIDEPLFERSYQPPYSRMIDRTGSTPYQFAV